jgi:hypothetical protein
VKRLLFQQEEDEQKKKESKRKMKEEIFRVIDEIQFFTDRGGRV